MKYVYCTIAIGDFYLKNAINFAKKLNLLSKSHKVLIVTDVEVDSFENCIFIKIGESETFKIKNYFNYNLKYIPIHESSKLDFEYVFFIDSDWEVYLGYSEDKIFKFLEYFEESKYDFLFERPHLIGHAKHDNSQCFWTHKIEPYNLMSTTKYDLGHVCNEQFLVFKNNQKLKVFCEKWKERNQFCVDNEVWAFAEGLEIGMSSIDAGMISSWEGLSILDSCFKFSSIEGKEYVRF